MLIHTNPLKRLEQLIGRKKNLKLGVNCTESETTEDKYSKCIRPAVHAHLYFLLGKGAVSRTPEQLTKRQLTMSILCFISNFIIFKQQKGFFFTVE